DVRRVGSSSGDPAAVQKHVRGWRDSSGGGRRTEGGEMRRTRAILAVSTALVVVAAATLASAASAGTRQTSGVMAVVDVGDPFDVTDDVTQVWGDLIGFWWTTSFDLGVA